MPRVKHVVLFACVHAVLTIGLFAYGFDLSAVDGIEPPRVKELAFAASGVLLLPGRLLWTHWASKNLRIALELLLFLANSALWGFLVAAVARGGQSRRRS
jgi:hypothetical protein